MRRNREKKGISTIIAAVFMIAIIVVGLNVLSSGLSFQNNLGQVVTERSTAETEQGRERIELRDVGIDSNKFNMTVVNSGTLPAKLVRMWVTNTSDTTNGWHKNYTLNDVINPGDSLAKLGQSLALTAKNSSSYELNIVTERGSTANFKILSPNDSPPKLSITVMPRSAYTGSNVTVTVAVSNNRTDGNMIQTIKPLMNPTVTNVGGTITPTYTLIESPSPNTERSLTTAETVFFKWVYKVIGDPNDKINFNATIQNAKQGNYIIESTTIADVSTQSTVTGQIITNSGIVTMNFTTFQLCNPSTQNCFSNSADWKPAWSISTGVSNKYILRVNLTNNGVKDIFLDQNTATLAFHVQTGGGGNAPVASYMKNASTTTSEDLAYSPNYSIKLPKKVDGQPAQYVTLYFGATAAGGSTLQSYSDTGLYAVSIILFGYEDGNNDGIYQSATDTNPYSQNIPFQGFKAT